MAETISSGSLDSLDRRIINRLQDGFPISEQPYADVAVELGTDESTLIARIDTLLDSGVLTRFGPLYHAEQLGGALTLAALCVPPEDFERVTAQVNAFPEVAHNYARDHELNMWFVLATETPERIQQVLQAIEHTTGYHVYNMPKKEEFFVGLKFKV
ncbi:MAG: Lrp/AsnC family transcriptional regulator [Gammaproteobacteria bacterium]|nr:Lrp/AsnC family transcriptional regulator [Gammaproteobacteria bacterium]